MSPTEAEADVVDMLTQDHREVIELLQEIRSSMHDDERRDLADRMISELVRHSIAEEMYVYPAMRRHLPDGEQAVQHDIEEHQQLEETMKRLEAADPGDTKFGTLLQSLETTLRDHIADEERDQFPALRASIPHDELVQIGKKVQLAKQLAPTRPHPMAPHSELFHKLVGPGVGFVDRLRDRLTNRST